MGLAASQARYLALSARKTNCEYEGQQINHQRLNLSNQSADLFNQMLTMTVPMPPSSSDFSKLQYSWSDGDLTFVLEDYYQIGQPDEDYNYVTTSYHYENVYTGQRKFLNDPQVQAVKTNHFYDRKSRDYEVTSVSYNADKNTYTFYAINPLEQEQILIFKESNQFLSKDTVEKLDYMYAGDTTNPGRIISRNTDATKYTLSTDGSKITYTDTAGSTEYLKVDIETDATALKNLKLSYGALYDPSKTYYMSSEKHYICKEDIEAVVANSQGEVVVRNQDLNIYFTDGERFVREKELRDVNVGDDLTLLSAENAPTFGDYTAIGNCVLTMITEQMFEDDISLETEIEQIIKDMGGDDGDTISHERLKKCFDLNGNYINGTLYKFNIAGKTYFTTVDDMNESLLSAYSEQSVANNSIDSQQSKLSYYSAIYQNKKVSETRKAMLETDGQGRFSTAKFEDDSVVYTLNVETIKDDDAYNDAMNKYYYEKEAYDKQIADINAKTEIIQAQDRQLQLKLEQLNTEQSALQTEMEACQKVVSKNIDNSFKTFGG